MGVRRPLMPNPHPQPLPQGEGSFSGVALNPHPAINRIVEEPHPRLLPGEMPAFVSA